MEILTSFGDGGRQPGQFFAVHSIAIDSKGNIYTTETYEGRRLQKFVYKGLAPVTKKDQGTVWPKVIRLRQGFGATGLLLIAIAAVGAQAPPDAPQPTNDLPNPFETIEQYFKMPERADVGIDERRRASTRTASRSGSASAAARTPASARRWIRS